jgi:hypothetical protein
MVHRRRRFARGLSVLMLGGMLAGWRLPLAPLSLSLNPPGGAAGTSVTALGEGFTAGVPVSLTWDGAPIGGGTVSADGSVAVGFSVPGDAPAGTHSVALCAFSCGQNFEEVSASFEVMAPTLSCLQLQNCTPTPTRTSPPTPTLTCQQQQNCTATPSSTPSVTFTATRTPIGFTPSSTATATPVPSATASPTPPPTATATIPAGWIGRLSDTVSDLFGGLTARLGIVTRTPTPVPVDIELVKVEITQGIQCLDNPDCADNSVGLYERRPTLVRAYLRLKSGPAFVNNVSGTLCLGSVYDRGCPFPVRPLSPITVERVSDPVGLFRGNPKASLNFLVPSDWIDSPKSFFLTVNVNPGGERVAEPTYDNNSLVENVTFGRRRRMDVVFVPFLSNGAAAIYEDRWPIVGWLQLAYPTNDIHVWTTGMWLVKDYNFNDTGAGGCRGWSTVLNDLEWFRGKNWQIYYGMVNAKSVTPGTPYSGCGRYDGAFVSTGTTSLSDRRPGETAAQELGHNYERHHAPGGGGGSPDSGFPNSFGNLDEYGVDIVRMQVYPPGTSYDFMSYAGSEANKWISLYTWRALEAALPLASIPTGRGVARPLDSRQAESDFLVASGLLRPEGVTIAHGFFRLALPNDSADSVGDGPYSLELLAEDGTTLQSRTFGPVSDSNAEPIPSGSFVLRQPWIDGTTAVLIRFEGEEIGRWSTSANAPAVHLIEPNGGEMWGGGDQTVRWEASDADGDPLQTLVEYSRDDGATWQTVALPDGGTSVSLEASYLPGSASARLRVTVSDGLRTTSDVSDGPFSVSDKPPEVFITSIEGGRTLQEGVPLILMAAGSDPEDGPIEDGFLWTSDKDGALGQGGFLTRSDLSLGEHALTLEATDSRGQRGTHTVHVVVEPAPAAVNEAGSASGGPATAGLMLMACGLVLAGGAAAGVVLLARRPVRGSRSP